MSSHYTFQAEFGDIKIPETQVKIAPSQKEENTWHIIFDYPSAELKNHFVAPVPKGNVRIRYYAKVPPCFYLELDHYDYTGVTATPIFIEDKVLELQIRYEMYAYKLMETKHVTKKSRA
jgi:hypothetical protein